MNAQEMQQLLTSCTGLFGPIGRRIKHAGQNAGTWVWHAPEFMNCGYTREQMQRFANASALAACELQRIVEIRNAIAAGGIEIRRGFSR